MVNRMRNLNAAVSSTAPSSNSSTATTLSTSFRPRSLGRYRWAGPGEPVAVSRSKAMRNEASTSTAGLLTMPDPEAPAFPAFHPCRKIVAILDQIGFIDQFPHDVRFGRAGLSSEIRNASCLLRVQFYGHYGRHENTIVIRRELVKKGTRKREKSERLKRSRVPGRCTLQALVVVTGLSEEDFIRGELIDETVFLSFLQSLPFLQGHEHDGLMPPSGKRDGLSGGCRSSQIAANLSRASV